MLSSITMVICVLSVNLCCAFLFKHDFIIENITQIILAKKKRPKSAKDFSWINFKANYLF